MASTTALFSSMNAQLINFNGPLFQATYLVFGGPNNGNDAAVSPNYESALALAAGNASGTTPPAQQTPVFYFYQKLLQWFAASSPSSPWPI
jgi:hypothetical protein